jgi:hypothetical protein
MSNVMGMVNRHPDVSAAARLGDPTLVDQEAVSAPNLVRDVTRVAAGGKSGERSLSVQPTNNGTLAENQPAPRYDDPASPAAPAVTNVAAAENQPDPGNGAKPVTDPSPDASAPDPNELKVNVDQPAPAPAQVNEIGQPDPNASQAKTPGSANSAESQELADDQAIASSKHKKKKGLRKIIPLN